MIEVAPSGEVPRDIRLGITWGPAEEGQFVAEVRARVARHPWIAEDPAELNRVRYSSRGMVEAAAIRAVIHAKIREGILTPEGERSGFLDRLRNTHGHYVADAVRVYARHPETRRRILAQQP